MMNMLDEDLVPEASVLARLPIFPLPNVVLLPGMLLPLNVFEPRYLELVSHAAENGGHIGVPLLRGGECDDAARLPAIEAVFGVGRLTGQQVLANGRRLIRLEGIGRVRIIEELPADGFSFRRVRAQALPERQPSDDARYAVLCAQVERLARTLAEDDRLMVETWINHCDRRAVLYALSAVIPNLEALREIEAGARAPSLGADLRLQQSCLEECDPDRRLTLLLERASALVDEMGSSGEFPMNVLN
jgi:Lon protease-like protein